MTSQELREELKSGGAYPEGPCSAWPRSRNAELTGLQPNTKKAKTGTVELKPPGIRKMAGGLMRTAGQALANGRVSKEIREARYDTCKSCPFFDEESKRCNDCGCFMEAKTWVGGDPDMLCPQKKWEK